MRFNFNPAALVRGRNKHSLFLAQQFLLARMKFDRRAKEDSSPGRGQSSTCNCSYTIGPEYLPIDFPCSTKRSNNED
jgi:hypothetical protein